MTHILLVMSHRFFVFDYVIPTSLRIDPFEERRKRNKERENGVTVESGTLEIWQNNTRKGFKENIDHKTHFYRFLRKNLWNSYSSEKTRFIELTQRLNQNLKILILSKNETNNYYFLKCLFEVWLFWGSLKVWDWGNYQIYL